MSGDEQVDTVREFNFGTSFFRSMTLAYTAVVRSSGSGCEGKKQRGQCQDTEDQDFIAGRSLDTPEV